VMASVVCGTVVRMTDSSAWAQLVSTTDIETEPIQLTKNMFTIGRNRGLVALHCFVRVQNLKMLVCVRCDFDQVLIIH